MSPTELPPLLPLLVLAASAVAVSGLIALHRSHLATALLSALGLVVTLAVLPGAHANEAATGPLVAMDSFSIFFIALTTAATLAVVAMAYGYLRGRPHAEELYALLLFANLGAALLVASVHFASFFFGLETLSVSLYAMIAYPRLDLPLEAGFKYLVLAAVSAAFLLFGFALLYAASGTLELAATGRALAAGTAEPRWMLAGVLLVLTAISFKLGVVPFHLWAPDVFEGAPAPATAFIATVSKGSIFALLLRYAAALGIAQRQPLAIALGVIAVLSMLLGNLLALRQQNLKRLLAYSSIAHMGYLLVALLAAGAFAREAISFYLVAYFVTTLGAFATISLVSHEDRDRDAISDYQGLFWRRPGLALALSLMLLSLAGIPLTAGFVGKYYVLAAGVDEGLWVLVLTMVGASVIGLYVYLRVLVALFSGADSAATPSALLPSARAGAATLVVLVVLLLWLGLAPATAIDWIRPLVATP
jgi:NADH-quinone oxidoreductase subunit N